MPHAVYILANHLRLLCMGVTDELRRRTLRHRIGLFLDSFSDNFILPKLVYFEEIESGQTAVNREQPLKGPTRMEKIKLIERTNPDWCDLASDWYAADEQVPRQPKSTVMEGPSSPDRYLNG